MFEGCYSLGDRQNASTQSCHGKMCTSQKQKIKIKMKTNKKQLKIGSIDKHTFINIVLTDGEDTDSKISQDELMVWVHKLNQELGSACKTFLMFRCPLSLSLPPSLSL